MATWGPIVLHGPCSALDLDPGNILRCWMRTTMLKLASGQRFKVRFNNTETCFWPTFQGTVHAGTQIHTHISQSSATASSHDGRYLLCPAHRPGRADQSGPAPRSAAEFQPRTVFALQAERGVLTVVRRPRCRRQVRLARASTARRAGQRTSAASSASVGTQSTQGTENGCQLRSLRPRRETASWLDGTGDEHAADRGGSL